MKQIGEFQTLFKLNFPVEENYEYYVNTLMKSPFYAGLGNVIKEFEQYEKDIEDQGLYGSVKSYKLDYALPKIKNYILQTKAYSKLQADTFGNSKLRTKDELRKNDDTLLVSIDFKSANYNALKTYDESGELYGSWDELCIALDIHPVLAKSKSFRQYVFGNTNPGRLQKVQHQNIVKIVDGLILHHSFEEDDFVFISHDEFIVRLRPDHRLATNRIHILNSAIGNIIQNEGINMPTHYKIFKNISIGSGMCVQTQYQVKMGGLSEKYTLLFKVPGNKFFKYFKTHILKEPIDRRDLCFISDGDLCYWSTEEDSISERITPEGEISIKEIEHSYPHLLKRLKCDVSSLSEQQLRKVINIFLDTCNHCHNEESGCQCWNDD